MMRCHGNLSVFCLQYWTDDMVQSSQDALGLCVMSSQWWPWLPMKEGLATLLLLLETPDHSFLCLLSVWPERSPKTHGTSPVSSVCHILWGGAVDKPPQRKKNPDTYTNTEVTLFKSTDSPYLPPPPYPICLTKSKKAHYILGENSWIIKQLHISRMKQHS